MLSEDSRWIQIISAEAKGRVCQIDVWYRPFYMGIQHDLKVIFERRLRTLTSVAVHKPSNRFESGHWAQQKLVAFGSVSEVIVVSMKDIKEVFKLKRPQICRPTTVPYIEIGFRHSPSMQAYSDPPLAKAWDSYI